MADLTVVVTGSGAPGITGTLYSLKNNFDGRAVRTVGTDTNANVIGKHLCDAFHRIASARDASYVDDLLRVCSMEGADVVVPQNTAELSVLAENRERFRKSGVRVLVSSPEAIARSNDKHELLKLAREAGVPFPQFDLVTDWAALVSAAEGLGWPERAVVVKPPDSNGMRGVRVIDESFDAKAAFFSEKPASSLTVRMEQLHYMIGEAFPPLLVTEYLPGEEYTVDVLRAGRVDVVPRRRCQIRSGITFEGELSKNDEIIEYSKTLAERTGLKYAFGFQFKFDREGVPKLLESNPRVQGTMVLSTFGGANVIYGALKHLLGEAVPPFQVVWGTRLLRYWGGIGLRDGRTVGSL